MKNVQISYELFVSLLKYHLAEDYNCEEKIQIGLENKLDALAKHEMYSKYKTALTKEEREKARKEYLDKIGMHKNFRW